MPDLHIPVKSQRIKNARSNTRKKE